MIIKCIARSHARANACHTHGTPHRADISTSSVVRLRVYVDDRDATDATQRTVSDAECVARAVASAAVHLSSFEFREFLAILFSWVHIVKRIEGLGI